MLAPTLSPLKRASRENPHNPMERWRLHSLRPGRPRRAWQAVPAPNETHRKRRISPPMECPANGCKFTHQRLPHRASRPNRTRADKNSTHRRRPPTPAAVSGRHAVGAQPAGNIGEASTARILEANALDYCPRKHRRSSSRMRLPTRAAELDVLEQKPIELPHRDQSLPPRRLDRVDQRHDAPIDRRDADAKSLRRLPAAVSQPLDLCRLAELIGTDFHPPGHHQPKAPSPLSLSLPSRTHRRRTVIAASDSTCGASVSRGYRGE
jgi:hypothetical protein